VQILAGSRGVIAVERVARFGALNAVILVVSPNAIWRSSGVDRFIAPSFVTRRIARAPSRPSAAPATMPSLSRFLLPLDGLFFATELNRGDCVAVRHVAAKVAVDAAVILAIHWRWTFAAGVFAVDDVFGRQPLDPQKRIFARHAASSAPPSSPSRGGRFLRAVWGAAGFLFIAKVSIVGGPALLEPAF
jgi:hypothetical protein